VHSSQLAVSVQLSSIVHHCGNSTQVLVLGMALQYVTHCGKHIRQYNVLQLLLPLLLLLMSTAQCSLNTVIVLTLIWMTVSHSLI
jgi:hypothetical protein